MLENFADFISVFSFSSSMFLFTHLLGNDFQNGEIKPIDDARINLFAPRPSFLKGSKNHYFLEDPAPFIFEGILKPFFEGISNLTIFLYPVW